MCADMVDQLSPDARRWKVAHRLFFVQTQGLVLAINAYERAPSEDLLNAVVELFLGSPVMMMFAADFLDEDYSWVRKDMEKIDPKFSGQYSADHAELLRRLPALRKAKENFPKGHDRVGAALEAVYCAHALVCHRFVGEAGSMANPEANAPELLRTKFLRKSLVILGAIDRARAKNNRGGEDV